MSNIWQGPAKCTDLNPNGSHNRTERTKSVQTIIMLIPSEWDTLTTILVLLNPFYPICDFPHKGLMPNYNGDRL